MSSLPSVILSIARLSSTNEYKVVYKEQTPKGTFEVNEAKSYYTDDPEDAVLTFRDQLIDLMGSGRSFKLGSKYTLNLVNKYSKSHRRTKEVNLPGGEG